MDYTSLYPGGQMKSLGIFKSYKPRKNLAGKRINCLGGRTIGVGQRVGEMEHDSLNWDILYKFIEKYEPVNIHRNLYNIKSNYLKNVYKKSLSSLHTKLGMNRVYDDYSLYKD